MYSKILVFINLVICFKALKIPFAPPPPAPPNQQKILPASRFGIGGPNSYFTVESQILRALPPTTPEPSPSPPPSNENLLSFDWKLDPFLGLNTFCLFGQVTGKPETHRESLAMLRRCIRRVGSRACPSALENAGLLPPTPSCALQRFLIGRASNASFFSYGSYKSESFLE